MKSKVKKGKIKVKEIDWGKKQILIGKNSGVVVMYTGENCKANFTGMVIGNPSLTFCNIGYMSEGWVKSGFEVFEDKVVLSN